jgi:hypothetical protein
MIITSTYNTSPSARQRDAGLQATGDAPRLRSSREL